MISCPLRTQCRMEKKESFPPEIRAMTLRDFDISNFVFQNNFEDNTQYIVIKPWLLTTKSCHGSMGSFSVARGFVKPYSIFRLTQDVHSPENGTLHEIRKKHKDLTLMLKNYKTKRSSFPDSSVPINPWTHDKWNGGFPALLDEHLLS